MNWRYYWQRFWRRIDRLSDGHTPEKIVGVIILLFLVGTVGYLTAAVASTSTNVTYPTAYSTTILQTDTIKVRGRNIVRVRPVVKNVRVVSAQTVLQTQTQEFLRTITTPGGERVETDTYTTTTPVVRRVVVTGPGSTQTVGRTDTVRETDTVTKVDTVTNERTDTVVRTDTRTETETETETVTKPVTATVTTSRTETQTQTQTVTNTVPVTVVEPPVTVTVTGPAETQTVTVTQTGKKP